jgi:hypothetical protein
MALLRLTPLLLGALLHAQSGITVEGTVVNRVTHQGISGVSVTLDRGTAGLAYRAITDSSGAFKIANVDPGDYLPIFEKSGLAVVDAAVKPIRIDGPRKFRAEMTPWTRVSGRVLDPSNKPVPKVRVSLIPMRVGRNSSGTVATTDSNGSFTIAMQAGRYRLLADPYQSDDLRRGEPTAAPPPSSADSPRVWAPTYYPSVTAPQDAQPVVIATTDLLGFDIHLQAVPTFHIRGTLFDTRGAAARGIPLKLVPPPAHWWAPEEADTVSGDSGAFDFPAVRPGEWHIVAEIERGESSLMGFASATVTSADVPGVAVRLAEPFTMKGKVEGAKAHESGDLCESAGVSLISTEVSREASGEVQEDGSLKIPEVYPGRYRAQLCGVPAGHYLASIFLGDRDVLGQEFTLGPGAPPLRVVFKSDGGTVRGAVDQGEGRAVALIPADESLLDAMFVATTQTGEGGRYEFTNVRPGEYRAVAFDHLGDPDALTDPIFVRSLSSWTTTVRVEKSQAVPLDLKVVHWPE